MAIHIANFRKDNGRAIANVCRHFVLRLGLFSRALGAIDGSKFKAVNNRDRDFNNAKLQRRMEETSASIDRYLSDLDTDPDTRSMKTRGTGIVSYNVQTAVDAKHHLIAAQGVTQHREPLGSTAFNELASARSHWYRITDGGC